VTSPPSAPPPAYPSNIPLPPPTGTPIWVTVVAALTCLGIGLSVSVLLRSGSASQAAVQPCPSVAPRETPKPTPDSLTLAAEGNSKAMEEITGVAVEQRTVAQAIALSKGRSVEKRMALDLLRETLEKAPETDSLKRLMQFAQEGDTAREAIGIAANLPGTKGNDLLYEISTAKTTPPEMAMLASGFLGSKEVRAKSAPALALVFDLRDATTCEQRQAILEKAVDIGDKRLVRLIVPLTKKAGCGDKKNDDCNPCLRADNQKVIRDALSKTQSRKPPLL